MIFSIYLLFSQGMWVINEASKEYSFDINPLEVLRIWKGGCIIRAKLLDFIIEVLKEDMHNYNLLSSERSGLFERRAAGKSNSSTERFFGADTYSRSDREGIFYTICKA